MAQTVVIEKLNATGMTGPCEGQAGQKPGRSVRQQSLNPGNRGTGWGGLQRLLCYNMWVALEDV